MRGLKLVLAVACLVALAATFSFSDRTPIAEASTTPYPVNKHGAFKGSIGSPAVICTAVTGSKLVIHKITLTNATAGYVTISSDTSGAAATDPGTQTNTLFNVYCPANTEVIVVGGPGVKAAAGKSVYARADGGTGTVSVQTEFNISD